MRSLGCALNGATAVVARTGPEDPREPAFDIPAPLCHYRAMPGEPETQLSLTGAPGHTVTGGAA
jgi:hypothetical protein